MKQNKYQRFYTVTSFDNKRFLIVYKIKAYERLNSVQHFQNRYLAKTSYAASQSIVPEQMLASLSIAPEQKYITL